MIINKPSIFFCLKIVAAENNWRGGTLTESEFYYTGELEFQDNSDLEETNYERLGERENEGNSQEEIETFVKTVTEQIETQQRK